MSTYGKLLKKAFVRREVQNEMKVLYYFDATMIDLPDLNEIRKYLYQNHPRVAIDALKVTKNTSSTTDATYLALLSYLIIDDSSWNGEMVSFLGEEYKGSFSIKMVGNNNLIYPTDFETTQYTNGLQIKSDPEGPIVFLRSDEEIDLTAYVKEDKSSAHAKFYSFIRIYVVPNIKEEDQIYHGLMIEAKNPNFDEGRSKGSKLLKLKSDEILSPDILLEAALSYS